MKVLVTGGAGFIGSHLAEELLSRGNELVVLDNLSTGSRSNISHLECESNFIFVEGSILDENVLRRCISECDTVYHLAAVVGVKLVIEHPLLSLKTNVRGTENVLECAREKKIRVIIASTSEIYGKAEDGLFREEDDRVLGTTTISRWSYSCTKAMDEFLSLAYFREYGVPVIILRLFNVCGPRQSGQYGMVIPRLIEQALRGDPLTIYGDGKQTRSFTHVKDVINVMIALSEHQQAEGEIFNVGSDEGITINELAGKIKGKVGSDSPIIHIPYEKVFGEGFEDMRHRVPDISKIKHFVNYNPQNGLDKILDETIKYFRERLNRRI